MKSKLFPQNFLLIFKMSHFSVYNKFSKELSHFPLKEWRDKQSVYKTTYKMICTKDTELQQSKVLSISPNEFK